MATYNRSNVLRLAIESVRWQTYANWELIVVGDCCTDDTADIVASFNDPRIRFYNLPQNVGEQSGPNNFGCQQARGEFIAFLNHDDLYFPRHLREAVRLLQEREVQLVFTRRYSIDGPNQTISSKPPSGTLEYEPRFYRASVMLGAPPRIDRRGRSLAPCRSALQLAKPGLDFSGVQGGEEDQVHAGRRCGRDFFTGRGRHLQGPPGCGTARILRAAPARTRLFATRRTSPSAHAVGRAVELLRKQRTWRGLRNKTLSLARLGLIRCVVRGLGRHLHPLGVHWFISGRGRKGTFIQALRHRRGLPHKKLNEGGFS